MVINRRRGHPLFYKILDELADLHSIKNADYATEDNPLSNFNRVGKWCKEYGLVTEGYEPLKVCIIYALKQIDAYMKLLKHNEKGGVEGIPERMRDVAVYHIIAEILYKEGLENMKVEKK